jgi:type IV secretory pathway protease TraF
MSRALLAAGGTAGLAALVAPTIVRVPPALLWNVTASAPIGLYWVRGGGSLGVGDWVAARAPQNLRTMFAERGYLPPETPLVKQITALSPQRVCRLGARVTVGARTVAWARTRDWMGRVLPVWGGCRRLHNDQLFLLNAARDSLDGRYFGPSSARDIVGHLTPLWIVRGAAR